MNACNSLVLVPCSVSRLQLAVHFPPFRTTIPRVISNEQLQGLVRQCLIDDVVLFFLLRDCHSSGILLCFNFFKSNARAERCLGSVVQQHAAALVIAQRWRAAPARLSVRLFAANRALGLQPVAKPRALGTAAAARGRRTARHECSRRSAASNSDTSYFERAQLGRVDSSRLSRSFFCSLAPISP